MNNQQLLKDHIAECLAERKSHVGWANLSVNTTDYALVSFLRGLNVRHRRDSETKAAALNYVGIDCDASAESKAADLYFYNNGKNSMELNHISINDCIKLKDRILEKGIDGFIAAI